MYEFKAESMEDAMSALWKWMNAGIIPVAPYVVWQNPEREGYFIAK